MSHPFKPTDARHRLPLRLERDGTVYTGTGYSDGFDIWVSLDTPKGPVWRHGPHFLFAARHPQFYRVFPNGQWTDLAMFRAEGLLLDAIRVVTDADPDGLPPDCVPLRRLTPGIGGTLTLDGRDLHFRAPDDDVDATVKACMASFILIDGGTFAREQSDERVWIAPGTLATFHPAVDDLPPFLALVHEGQPLDLTVPPRLVVELADANLWLWAQGGRTYIDDSPDSYGR